MRETILTVNSLSVLSWMVGLVSIPIFVILNTNYMTRLLLLVFDSIDMLAGLASVFILAVISLERMHAIGWPLRHRSLSSCVYIVGIVIPWCLAAIASSSIETSLLLLRHNSSAFRCYHHNLFDYSAYYINSLLLFYLENVKNPFT